MAEDIAKFGLEMDSSGVIKGTRALDDLEKQSGKTERATQGVEKSTKLSATAMGIYAAGIGAATVALNKSIALHKDFTAAISDLSAITGATGKDLEFYKEQALAIGSATTLSASQAAVAFKLIASAKPDLLASKEALAAVTFEAVKLAEAAGLEMPEAADALGSALNQFGADASEASRFINVLAAGSKFGASEIGDMSVALREAGTVSSAAGLSFEETNAALQSLAGVAIKGSKAGVALRNILVNLQTQSDDSINPSMVGLSEALSNLGEKQLTTAEMAKLFGKEQLASAQALINSADKVAILTKNLTGTTTAYEQAAVKVDNLAGDQKKMDSAWESAALTLGEELDPALRATTQFITSMANPVKQLILEFADLGDALGAYAAIAASALSLDFDAVGVIIDARKEERALVDEKIAALYEVKSATDQVNEAEQRGREGRASEVTPAIGATGVATGIGATGGAVSGSQVAPSIGGGEGDEYEGNQARLDALADQHYQYEIAKSIATEQESMRRKQILSAEIGAAGNILTGLSQLMSREGKKQSATQKILARAGIIASTAQAVMNALAVPPYPLGVSLAAGAALQGAIQLKNVGGGGSSTPTPSLQSPAGFGQDSLSSNIQPNGPQTSTPQTTFIFMGGAEPDDAQVDSLLQKFSDKFNEGSHIMIRRDSPQAQEIAAATGT